MLPIFEFMRNRAELHTGRRLRDTPESDARRRGNCGRRAAEETTANGCADGADDQAQRARGCARPEGRHGRRREAQSRNGENPGRMPEGCGQFYHLALFGFV